MERVHLVTVTGILYQRVEIGGETTGWVIELDAELEIKAGMSKVKHIEVDPNDRLLDSLKGREVKVSGYIAWRWGVERGDYAVIVIESIKELN